MSRIIHYRYLSSYQTIFIIISIWIHNIPWPECQRLYRRTQCSGTRSEPWETGRASMSSSLIQIMNPKQHSSWLQTLTLSHRKWKQNRNKIKQGDKERDIFYWHRFSRRRKSQYQLLEYLTFEGKALNREKVDEITNFKCQSISPLLLELNERVCCLDPDFVFVFCTLWSHYAALCAHIMLRRNSFRVSLGRRCRPRGSCLQTRDQLGELDNTDLMSLTPAFVIPDLDWLIRTSWSQKVWGPVSRAGPGSCCRARPCVLTPARAGHSAAGQV